MYLRQADKKQPLSDFFSNSLFFSFYRCGGQGDLLSGSLSVFLFWATRHQECPDPGPGVIAGWAAARLARACAAQAFAQHGRATTTSDLIDQVESAFSRLYESETCLWPFWFLLSLQLLQHIINIWTKFGLFAGSTVFKRGKVLDGGQFIFW